MLSQTPLLASKILSDNVIKGDLKKEARGLYSLHYLNLYSQMFHTPEAIFYRLGKCNPGF